MTQEFKIVLGENMYLVDNELVNNWIYRRRVFNPNKDIPELQNIASENLGCDANAISFSPIFLELFQEEVTRKLLSPHSKDKSWMPQSLAELKKKYYSPKQYTSDPSESKPSTQNTSSGFTLCETMSHLPNKD